MLNGVRFDAKRSPFWCLMQGVLVLNAAQNAVKCKTKKHKNPQQLYKQNPLERWNTWLNGAKQPLKSGVLGAKCSKMQVLGLEFDKPQGLEGYKKQLFTNLPAWIFARTERKLERHCKITNNNLSFWVDELMFLGSVGFSWVHKPASWIVLYLVCGRIGYLVLVTQRQQPPLYL